MYSQEFPLLGQECFVISEPICYMNHIKKVEIVRLEVHTECKNAIIYDKIGDQ